MKVTAEQFHRSLNAQPLQHCYWLSGDEPLQVQEASDALRQKAFACGFGERQVLDVNSSFDWPYWQRDIHSYSLFSSQRYVELRLQHGKLAEPGIQALQQYLDRPNPEVVLVLCSPKLEQHAATQKIYTRFVSQGIVCPFWPLERQQLPAWFTQRLKREDLTVSREGLQCLIDFTEGHLLAANQAINLLTLLYPKQALSLEQINQALVKQARFDVFHLAEVFLTKNTIRYQAMLHSLKATGVEPVLVLWALVKEIRLMLQLTEIQATGQALTAIWPTLGIFDKRRPWYQTALTQKRDWCQLMIQAAKCDVVIKGYGTGDPWLSFSRLLTDRN